MTQILQKLLDGLPPGYQRRVTGSGLSAAGYRQRATGSGSPAAGYRQRVTGSGLLAKSGHFVERLTTAELERVFWWWYT